MNKKQLTEQEIRTRYITPAIQAAGWKPGQIREEVTFDAGRIIVRGAVSMRSSERKRVDYLLSYNQIDTRLHERLGMSQGNFARTLPAPQSELARQLLKDPYTFDFLSLGEGARERDLERALIEHLSAFLLELGIGFAFVGRQRPG